MINVDRTQIAIPRKISDLIANQSELRNEIDEVRRTGKIKKGIYRDNTVETALITLYQNVCFLCQKKLDSGYDVEHFLPWHPNYPERAYDWNNLHQSCKRCNSKKRKVIYKVQNKSGGVADILLLDPSDPNVDVEQLIFFCPKTNKAVATVGGDTKVAKTVEFLNEADILSERQAHWISLTNLVLDDRWLPTYSLLKQEYRDYQNITLNLANPTDRDIGDLCYRLLSGYLLKSSDYNRYIKTLFIQKFNIQIELIRQYANCYAAHNSLTEL